MAKPKRPIDTNQLAKFITDVATGQLLAANVGGNSRRLRALDTNNLAPRLGIAWLATKDGKTVIPPIWDDAKPFREWKGEPDEKNVPVSMDVAEVMFNGAA